MGTVNLLNSSSNWRTSTTNSNIEITADTKGIKFRMPTGASSKTGWAKGCISFDASKYSEVVIKYSKISSAGITDLYCGVYNSITASSDDPATTSLKTSSFNKSEGGTITFTIPSSVSGTKYVGFRFYGNSHNTSSGSSEHIYVTSITATERGYTLTYNANKGTGGPSAVSNITSTTISKTVPTRDGYEFLGWSTSSSATSASYVAGDKISLSANVTLYAVWRELYTITYDANGGSEAPNSDTKKHGVNLTLSSSEPMPPENTTVTHTITLNANGGICSQDIVTVNHDVSYKFDKWNTASSGSGTSYQPGGSYTNNSNVTLYAQYTEAIKYNAVTLPTPTRSNYDFLGWSVNDYDESGAIGEYTPTEDITLYAIWKIRGQVYIRDQLEGVSPYQVLIYDGSSWNQYTPYIYTYYGWEPYSG